MRKKSIAKRDKILRAAFAVVCEKGYYETRLEDVAKVAGVAKGTVYLYFKDKPDLYLGIIRWLIGKAVAIVEEVKKEPASAPEQLRQVFHRWIDALSSQPATIDLVFPEMREERCEIARRFRREVLPEVHRLIKAIADVVRSGIRQAEFRRVEPRLAALSFLNAFRSAVLANTNWLGVRTSPQRALDIFFYGINKD
ncbi:MAG: TetR/AcrR family transcriptional regulator [candidate division WOR-3 bacterium]